jgi:hypothetical protein
VREECSTRWDELARLAATKGVSRRQVLKAAGATLTASVLLGCTSRSTPPRSALSRNAQLPTQPEQEVCSNEILGQTCYFVGCGAAMASCVAVCATPNKVACATCLGGVERCMRSCGKELNCHCVTGVACRDSFGVPFGPAYCCHPPEEECFAGLCVPACKACEHRSWSGGCVSDCKTNESCCNGTCIDTQSNLDNCGFCGNKCTGGQTCQGGICSCPTGLILCNHICVDIHTDKSNCGFCGNICPGAGSLPQLPGTVPGPTSDALIVGAMGASPSANTNPPCNCGAGASPCLNSIGCICCPDSSQCCNSGTSPAGPTCCNPDETCCVSAGPFTPNFCCKPPLTCGAVSCNPPTATGQCCAGVCC